MLDAAYTLRLEYARAIDLVAAKPHFEADVIRVLRDGNLNAPGSDEEVPDDEEDPDAEIVDFQEFAARVMAGRVDA